jgi:predicted alpha/beta-fold hydrolase
MVNALDDPFMGPLCHPAEIAQRHPNLYLEQPAHGGHQGFLRGPWHRWNWCEERAVQFAMTARAC